MFGKKFFFDKQDHELLTFVNKVLIMQREDRVSADMLHVNLHPHGIKTLALSRDMRVANAMIRLLGSTKDDDPAYRLQALRTLFDEMLNGALTEFRRNTARVLVEIMKALIRAQGDTEKQLYLASDFRRVAQGKPHVVRKFLKEYGLLEMPETWSQLTFDHHVHDANSKGRKSPTHLIMDTALKGIRYLTVIYYNFIDEEAASELLQAAKIIGLHLRIGIEFSLPFDQKHVQFVWAPRYTSNPVKFMEFLAEKPVQMLMKSGREASAWRALGVYDLLQAWNSTHSLHLAQAIGVDAQELGPISQEKFKAFIGAGQASLNHLAECIYNHIAPALKARRQGIIKQAQGLSPQDQQPQLDVLQEQRALLKDLSIDYIYDTYVNPALEKNTNLTTVCKDDPRRPELLRLTPLSLLDWITSIQSGGFLTLQVGGLTCEDVLVLLWQCQGLISHLEIFNVQQWQEGRLEHIEAINALQQALNLGSAPRLKNIVLLLLQEREAQDALLGDCPQHKRRKEVLREILSHIMSLKNLYSSPKLRSRMGTNTTDRTSSHRHMGLVFPETLPRSAAKILDQEGKVDDVPFTIDIHYLVRHTPSKALAQKSLFTRIIRALPGGTQYGYVTKKEWRSHSASAAYGKESNICLLESLQKKEKIVAKEGKLPPKEYLNTNLSNVLKVVLGFIPASFAFYYTQTWWVLAWFGPIIWFGITGVRNIVQFVVAGRGLHRYSLMRWSEHVSWSRLCDSLLYTGFSVPLLELGVRTLLLQDLLNMNTTTHTVLVYTIMSVVNGLYISWHNIIRGLPKEAVVGNLFRSALAIPMALLFNELVLDFLTYVARVDNAEVLVATSSAIISKMASDTVAALIEGYADKKNLVRMRNWDYKSKLRDVFQTYVRLDLAFPHEDINDMLRSPRVLLQRVADKDKTLYTEIIINALDLQYFWYYRPRSKEVCKKNIQRMTPEERTAFAFLQLVLMQERHVSQLFVDGLVGRNFSSSLEFYLKTHRQYVKTQLQMCAVNYAEDECDAA